MYNLFPINLKLWKGIKNVESLQYHFSTIRAATNNFSDKNILRKGGFGIVFKVRKTLLYGKIINLYQTKLNQTDWNCLIYKLFL